MILINKKLVVLIIFIAIICLSANVYASTQTVVSGVKAGDSFSYSINTYWSTSNSSVNSPPAFLVNYNQTRFYNVTVLYVEDVNVVAMNLWAFNNDTQQLSRVDMNIGNGTVYLVTGEMAFQGFFPANMTVGDLLRPSDSNSSLCVNSTETWAYSGGQREVNVVSFDYKVRDYYNTSIGTESTTYYIDKATGIVVKRVDSTVFPDQTGSLEWTLTATNLWDISASTNSFFEIPVILTPVAITIIVAAIISTIFLKKRRGSRH